MPASRARVILALLTVVGLFGIGMYTWRRAVARSQLARAWQLAGSREWAGVVKQLELYLYRNAQDDEAIALLARAYAELDDHLASAQWWDKISPNSSRKPSALLAQGTALFAADHAAKSEESWRRCLALAERENDTANFDQAANKLASLYWLQGRKSEIQLLVAQWLDRSYGQGDLTKHLQGLVWQLRVRLIDMEPIEAIEQLRRFVARNDDDSDSRRALGRYLASLGEYDEAEECLRRCLVQHPNDLRNWFEFLVLMIDSGELATAGKVIERFPAQARDSLAFQTALGRWAWVTGNNQAAEDAFQHVLNQDARDEKALAQIVNIVRQTGRPEQLREQLTILEETTRNRLRLQDYYTQLQQSWNPSWNDSLSIAYVCDSLGYTRESADWQRRAVVLSPAANVSVELLTTAVPDPGLGTISCADVPDVEQLITPSDRHARAPSDEVPIRFRNVAEQSGVSFSYSRGDTGQFWIVEPNGGGAAWLDADQDGWLDLFFINGCSLLPSNEAPESAADPNWSSRLFRNGGDGKFIDCTVAAGLVTSFYGQGCTVADFDDDGFPDLYLTGYGATALFHNCGDGTFQDVTTRSGTASKAFSTGCAFMDLNRDGILDLYVVNYVDFNPALHGKPCRNASSGEPEYCGPRCCPGMPDNLYMGNGDGTFEDVSASTGVAAVASPGFAVISADLNNDHWPDLYVANDGQSNTLWLNASEGEADYRIRLRSCGLEQGCALDGDGTAQGSMGIACGDIDHDGSLDLGVSNFYHEHYTLYHNVAGNGFEDVSIPYQLVGPTRKTMGWGTHFIDCDNDGWLDLFVANGHINRARDGATPYEMSPQLFRNSKHGKFTEVGHSSGSYFQGRYVARGAAFGDYDNDGLEDIAVVHHHTPAALLHNVTQMDHTVLVLKLIGRSSTRDAMNARVIATVRNSSGGPPLDLVREITPGTSYLSANDYRVRFGMDRGSEVDVNIIWPSGHDQTWHGLRPGGTYLVREMETGLCVLP